MWKDIKLKNTIFEIVYCKLYMKQKTYSFKLSLALSMIFLLVLYSSCRDDETIIRTVEVMKEDTCMFDIIIFLFNT